MRPGIGVEITREPIGVVGLITPWNFPIAIPAWKAAPALAYGNCVILKPADIVPASAWALAEIISRSGIPAGVFNLVMGRGSVIGDALVRHPGVHAISFTGSVGVGRRIAEACVQSHKKVQLEMGGKNPQVVLDDADLGKAVELSVQSAFYATGQRCTAASRLIVTEGIYPKFVDAVKTRMAKLTVGDALAAGTDIGPVSSQSQLEQDLSYIEIGQREGATLAAGGERLKRATEGFYMAPALFSESAPSMRINREEIFGPVASVIKVKDYDEALVTANDTAFGLSAGHRDHQPEVRDAFQAPLPGRDGDGEPADRRRGLPRAIRRSQGQQLWSQGAGPLRAGVLHRREDGVHRPELIRSDSVWHWTSKRWSTWRSPRHGRARAGRARSARCWCWTTA